MKRALLTIMIALAALTASAQNYKSLYQKYSDDERVTAVYISPAMFKMIGKLPEVRIEDNDLDLAPMIKSMTGFYMLQTEDKGLYGQAPGETAESAGNEDFREYALFGNSASYRTFGNQCESKIE